MSDGIGKPVILAVDDTPENLDVVKGILGPNYTVKVAINGPTALKIAEKQPPDLVLLDIMMPGMSGYEVCEQLKASPGTRDIPVIFLTAMDQTKDESSGFDLGAADYITKPVNPPILQARVKTHLALKQSMDELQKAYGIIKLQKDRMEEELNIGRDIQMSMLPLEFPPFPDRSEFSIQALLKPAREVGGDFYDFFFINKDELCVVIGDVSGKGVPAALFMAVTQTMIKSHASGDRSPASIVTRVNEELSQDNPQCMFVTLFLGIINVVSGEFRYSNAGHNPPYLLSGSEQPVCLAQRDGPIIGASSGLTYTENKIQMSKDDCLLIFTDGVTEAMNTGGELYGERRLEARLDEIRDRSTKKLVDGVLESVEEFAAGAEQADDITLLSFRLDVTPKDITHYKLQVEARADLTEIDRVNSEFDEFAQIHNIDDSAVKKVKIALDELLNNVISYGLSANEEHLIQLAMDYSEERLEISISDDGIPFNPFAQARPDTTLSIKERPVGGLGILLVEELMSEVSYRRHQNCNVVTLTLNAAL